MCFFSSTATSSAPLAIKRIGLEQGLSQSTIYAVIQDKSGYIWLGTGDGIDIYDGHSFKHLRNETGDISSLSNNYVKALLVSKDGSIWVGTLGGSLNRYDPKSETFKRYQSSKNNLHGIASKDIYSLYESKDGLIWIGSGAGASVFNPQENTFKHYIHSSKNQSSINSGPIKAITQTSNGTMWFGSLQSGISSLAKDSNHFKHTDDDFRLSDNAINVLYQGVKGSLWIGTESGGLNKLDITTNKITQYLKPSSNGEMLNNYEVTTLLAGENGELWVGTRNDGLNYFNPETGEFKNYRYSPESPNSVSSDAVISLFVDHSGMLWAGTFDSGVNIINYKGVNFEHYYYDSTLKNGVVNKMIWAIAGDYLGNLWIGTKNGLSHFEPDNGNFKSYFSQGKCNGVLSILDIRAILPDKNTLWLGTSGGGLIHFNPQTCNVKKYTHDEDAPSTLSSNYVRVVFKDNHHQLWIGTRNGLNKLNITTGEIHRYQADDSDKGALPHNRIRSLFEDEDGVLWVGTSGGLSRFNAKTDSFHTISFEQGLLSDNDIRNIWKDNKGILWLATEKGLTRLDVDNKKALFFYEKDGLTNNALYSLLVDGDYLWLTTNNGLSRFDRRDFSFLNFDINDGLQSNEFNINAALKSAAGHFYVGGINGFNRFIPSVFNRNKIAPKVSLKINRNGKQVNVLSKKTNKELIYTSKEKVNFIVSVLHYLNPKKNQYKYKLSGYDEDWITTSAQNHEISYLSLPPGEYLFQLTGYASNGISAEKTITIPIIVKPEFWRTPWAFLAYILLSLLLIYSFMYLRTNKLKRRSELLELAIQEQTLELEQKNNHLNNKTKELEAILKNQDDFYLRVAHEIRTPLTLIQTPSELLLINNFSQQDNNHLKMIMDATSRLKSLSDQMIQAATEERVHTAGVVSFDLSSHIASITEIYQSIAQEKNIDYHLFPLPNAAITTNKLVLESTLHNLLSNAFKYTNNDGKISVKIALSQDSLKIIIKDDGIGISQSNQQDIFTCFTRTEKAKELSKEGYGIGLYTVKQDITDFGGSIFVESEEGEGSIFTALIPCQFTLGSSFLHSSEQQAITLKKGGVDIRATILVIEDDKDIRHLLAKILEEKYDVILTGSAKHGLEQVQKIEPDLVLCDVMLPDGNGFEITKVLKNCEKTSHVPLILLTAVADMTGAKIGWDNGADDYIVKPFSSDDLCYRISSVLRNRQRLQKWYQNRLLQKNNVEDEETIIDSSQLQFIDNLNTAALSLIKNRNCNLNSLAEEMNQSGRTLQRHLKNLLGYSFSEYIKSVQLSLAKELLEKGALVKEASFTAGFNDPTYFTKQFKSEFLMTPTEYRKRFNKPK